MVEIKLKITLIQNTTMYHQKFETISLETRVSVENKETNRFLKDGT